MNTHLSKARAAQASGLVSLDPLAPALSACWTIGAFGRQRLYILSGKFGPEQRFCSRYVVFPDGTGSLPHGGRWRYCVLNGQQDYTKGRLDILQDRLAETPDPQGLLEHSILLGTTDDSQQAQQECVDHAVAAGHGRSPIESKIENEAEPAIAD